MVYNPMCTCVTTVLLTVNERRSSSVAGVYSKEWSSNAVPFISSTFPHLCISRRNRLKDKMDLHLDIMVNSGSFLSVWAPMFKHAFLPQHGKFSSPDKEQAYHSSKIPFSISFKTIFEEWFYLGKNSLQIFFFFLSFSASLPVFFLVLYFFTE